MSSVGIVDYGSGNLLSVMRAFEHCGSTPVLASTPEQIKSCERLVLPGVGAFEDGMRGLRDLGLIEPIREHARSGRPLLGICLGMQMLATESVEFGLHQGLDLIPGRVVSVPDTTTDGRPHKIPHIGWSSVRPASDSTWDGTILDELRPGTALYLVHSFHVVPGTSSDLLAVCDYGGHQITAVIRSGNIFGCQFHPEKSGAAGLAIIRRYLTL